MKDLRAPILTVPSFERISWLVHGFGTGAWHEEDFAATPAFAGFTPVIMRQLHSDIVHRLQAAPGRKLEGDALITNVPGLLLVVRTADCLPVLLVDESHRAVGSVHCGWRGTRARILERAIEAMREAYGTDPAALLAALGPCIGPCCYEVGPEVRASFSEAGFPDTVFHVHAERKLNKEVAGPIGRPESPGGRAGRSGAPDPVRGYHEAAHVTREESQLDGESHEHNSPSRQTRPGRSYLDLRAANAWLLESLGVPRVNISGAEACTSCEPSLLSYRRHPGEKRRMYNFVGMRAL